MKVPVQLQEAPPHEPKEHGKQSVAAPRWWQSLQKIYQQVAAAINGNIEFGNPTSGPVNILGNWISVTTPGAANTDFTVTHNLGRTAVGYIVMTKNAACDVYTSPTANPNPTTQLILRATAVTVALTIFVL